MQYETFPYKMMFANSICSCDLIRHSGFHSMFFCKGIWFPKSVTENLHLPTDKLLSWWYFTACGDVNEPEMIQRFHRSNINLIEAYSCWRRLTAQTVLWLSKRSTLKVSFSSQHSSEASCVFYCSKIRERQTKPCHQALSSISNYSSPSHVSDIYIYI